MALPFSLPERYKIVQLCTCGSAANAVTYDIISCKHAHKVWFVISHYSAGGDTDLTLSLVESTDVAGTTTTAVTATFPIWSDTNAGTASDTMTKRTDAASYAIDTGATTPYLVVIEWDPAKHSAGYDCIQLKDANGNASNKVNALAIIETRYPQGTPPSAIID